MFGNQQLHGETSKLRDNANEFQKRAKELEDETRKNVGWSLRTKLLVGGAVVGGGMLAWHYV